MPFPFAAVGAALSIGSSLLGASSSRRANDRARSVARLQSDLTYSQRMEEIRRVERDQGRTVGYNRAAIGASNIQFRGTAMKVLQDVRGEFARDIDWRRRSAASERNAIRSGAPGRSADTAATIGAIGSIGSTLLTYYGD